MNEIVIWILATIGYLIIGMICGSIVVRLKVRLKCVGITPEIVVLWPIFIFFYCLFMGIWVLYKVIDKTVNKLIDAMIAFFKEKQYLVFIISLVLTLICGVVVQLGIRIIRDCDRANYSSQKYYENFKEDLIEY
jgi:hypothetical protein